MPHDKRKCRLESRSHVKSSELKGNYHSLRAYHKAKKRLKMAKESRRRNRRK